MLQPGDTLAGYRIDAVIGYGGMGVVYSATQLTLGRQVALKVLSTTLVGNQSFRERFRREGRTAAALDHPNIVPIYEASESNSLMFIAMRLVDGPTLADRMARRDLDARESLRILRAIASALDRAHGFGLVHRDVKPQNILIDRSGHPYLADFGVTKGGASDGLTRTGDFVGSLSYAAPEQMRGEALTAACDIYALTCVLHQCLTGSLPFERETDAAVMHAHLYEPPPSLRARGLDVPAELDAVLERGMAKAAADRYQTASALLDAVEAAVSHLPAERLAACPPFPLPEPTEPPAVLAPISAEHTVEVQTPALPTVADVRREPPPPPPAPPAPPRRRWPAVAAGALGLLALAAPVAGFLAGGPGDTNRPTTQTRTAGIVSLTVPATWQASRSEIEGLKLADGLALSLSDAALVAGRAVDAGAVRDPVPADLRATWEGRGTGPKHVRVGDLRGLAYEARVKDGRRLRLVMIPTDKGWAAIACREAGAGAACERALTGVSVVNAAALATAPDPVVGKALDGAATAVAEARRREGRNLSDRSTGSRSRAAKRLAAAHRKAVRDLRGLEPSPLEASAVRAFTAALDDLAQAFTALGKAAARADRAAYRAAIKKVRRGDAALGRAYDALTGAGYEI